MALRAAGRTASPLLPAAPHLARPKPGTLCARNLGAGPGAQRTRSAMEQARGPRAEADVHEEEEEEAGVAMAAAMAAAGGTGSAVLQVAGLYRGLCAVRSRALGLGLVSPAQLRVFPVRLGSGRPAGGADGSGAGADLEANPFYDRYRDKIQQLRRCGRRPAAGGEGRRAARVSGGSDAFSAYDSPAMRAQLLPHSIGDASGLREAGSLANITQLGSELRVSAKSSLFPQLSLCSSSQNAEVESCVSSYEVGSSKRPALIIEMGT